MGEGTHHAGHWDERYAAEPVRPLEPDPVVVEVLADLSADRVPGHALDLACGLGRHARWLAAQGWAVTAVDYSAVGIARASTGTSTEATARQPRRRVASIPEEPTRTPVSWVVADVRRWRPEPPSPATYELVLCAYVHLDPPDFARISGWLAPGGRLVVVAHAPDATDGPRNPAYRYDEHQLAAAAHGLTIERLDHQASRLILLARRP
jgi:SAM-dependent methyltransferase